MKTIMIFLLQWVFIFGLIYGMEYENEKEKKDQIRRIIEEEGLIEEKAGLLYVKGEKEPFTGILVIPAKYGRLTDSSTTIEMGGGVSMETLIETEYGNGKRISSVWFYGGGAIWYKGYYKNNKKHGEWIHWNTKGEIESIEVWDQGKLTITKVWYYVNGILIRKGFFKNKKKHGEWIEWNLRGEIEIIEVWDEGRIIEVKNPKDKAKDNKDNSDTK
jgi:antitoxin component YwqK of YwqJK toxin-antitoxin module